MLKFMKRRPGETWRQYDNRVNHTIETAARVLFVMIVCFIVALYSFAAPPTPPRADELPASYQHDMNGAAKYQAREVQP